MKRLLLVAALVAGGCAAGEHPLQGDVLHTALYGLGPAVKEFPGPDGQKGYSIVCATGARSSECYEAAAKVCNGKYEILARGNVDDKGALDVVCKT